MPRALVPWQVHVLSFGPVTQKILSLPASGEVCAVFQRTFYLKSKSGLFCIGTEDLHDGPLNLIAKVPSTTDWRSSGVRLGERVAMGTDHLTVGRVLCFLWKDAKLWSPPVFKRPNKKNLARGLKNLHCAITGRVPPQGVGCLLVSTPDAVNGSLIELRAHAIVSELRTLLRLVFEGRKTGRSIAEALAPLIGMGPGLTPSGDDFIGGLMIGLCAVGCYGLVADIWKCLKLTFIGKSNDISRAHVNAAATGMAANHLHEMVDVLCAGGDLTEELINALEGIGHTSGWDALAGLVIALEESLKSNYLQSVSKVASW